MISTRPQYPNSPYSQIGDTKQTKAVMLDGGLDYVSPRSMVGPGKLLDSLNYEIVDRNGYKRADGNYRWDGGGDLQDDNIYSLYSSSASTDISGPVIGGYLYEFERPTTDPFGILLGYKVVSSTETYIFYARIDASVEPPFTVSTPTIRQLGVSTTDFLFLAAAGVGPTLASDRSVFDTVNYTKKFTDEAAYSPRNISGYWYDFLTTHHSDAKNGAKPFFTSGNTAFVADTTAGLSIPGLCYFRDKMYAVADTHQMVLDTLQAQIFPGDFLYSSSIGLVRVLVATLTQGDSWTGATTDHTALIAYQDVNPPSYYTASVTARFPFASGGGTTAGTHNVTLLRTGATVGRFFAEGYTSDHDYAGLYRSFTERQARTEGFISHITISDGGSGYNTPPTVTISGGGGYGAQAFARVSAGAITGIYVISQGKGYTTAPTVTVTAASDDAGAEVAPATITAVLSTWQNAGMRFVDTGWQVDFTGGSSASGFLAKVDRKKGPTGQSLNYSAARVPATADATGAGTTSPEGRPQWAGMIAPGSTSNPGVFGWFTSGSTAGVIDAQKVNGEDDTNYLYTPLIDTYANLSYSSKWITFGNFRDVLGDIPVGSVLNGIRLFVSYDVPSGATYPSAGQLPRFSLTAQLVKLTQHPTIPGQMVAAPLGPEKEAPLSTSYNGALDTSVTIGGATDLWSILGQTVDDLTKDGADFGVSLRVNVNRASTAVSMNFNFHLDDILMVVDYQNPNVTYYFSDNTVASDRNVIAADLVSYNLQNGSFIGGDAVGTLQLANLRYVELWDTTPRHSIGAAGTWKMYQSYTDASTAFGATAHIATVSAAMRYQTLDGTDLLKDEGSRYEIISANFYADDDYAGVYGVSGAGRAFYFDGTFFSRIFAVPLSESNSAAKDKPRHISNYRFHLALGYKPGTVLISRIGRPDDFDYTLGASSFSFGDRITGIQSLPGDYMAVFCESSIWGLTGASVQSFSRRNISPNSGAIEYTIVSAGDTPIFCDSRGISTLATVQEYGDFAGIRLSHKITPKLLTRLVEFLEPLSSNPSSVLANGIVCAYVVRAKNQYRVWFADGMQLVMSLVGPEREPQFSWIKYTIPGSNSQNVVGFRPLAVYSGVDDFGRERCFATPDVYFKADLLGKTPCRIFELNKFWGMDQGSSVISMPAYIITNYFYGDNPTEYFSLIKLLLEGSVRGVADLTVQISKNFNDSTYGAPQKLILGDPTVTGLPVDYHAESATASPAENGRNMLIKILNYSPSNFTSGEKTQIPQPPHYLQLLLIDHEGAHKNA